MNKFKTYGGETLTNVRVSLKIDGVRAHSTEGGVVSRKGKPLYNIVMDCAIAEVFAGTWEGSVSLVRTHAPKEIPSSFIYELSPNLDDRLFIGYFDTLTKDQVDVLFTKAISDGYEGLVLTTDKWNYKVKSVENYDVTILDIVEGTGKYVGKLGAFITTKGKVGTGFSDEQRKVFFSPSFIGETIEVKAMGLTPAGKLRHPRFFRMRFDK